MPNNLFNRFGNAHRQNNNNILAQIEQIKKDPGVILDILLQNEKISQSQYYELQPYKNNPEAIGKYLINNGKGSEINQAEQTAKGLNSN